MPCEEEDDELHDEACMQCECAFQGRSLGPWPQLSSGTEDQLAVRAYVGMVIRQLGTPPSPAGALSELSKAETFTILTGKFL